MIKWFYVAEKLYLSCWFDICYTAIGRSGWRDFVDVLPSHNKRSRKLVRVRSGEQYTAQPSKKIHLATNSCNLGKQQLFLPIPYSTQDMMTSTPPSKLVDILGGKSPLVLHAFFVKTRAICSTNAKLSNARGAIVYIVAHLLLGPHTSSQRLNLI